MNTWTRTKFAPSEDCKMDTLLSAKTATLTSGLIHHNVDDALVSLAPAATQSAERKEQSVEAALRKNANL